MHDLTAKIKGIDLAGVVRDAGVELHSRHGRLVGLCPFHPENTPSFFIFSDNRFKCFSCNEHGDSVDFLQRLHGIDFKSSLNHLGINQGRLTVVDKKKIAEAKRKQKRRQARAKRETELAWTLGTLIRWIHLAKKALTPENLHIYGGILDPLSWLEWGHQTLIHGDKLEKADALKSFEDFETIERGQLFVNGFDFEKWLRESDHKRILNSVKKHRDNNGTPNEFKTGSIEIPFG